ncbi:MAG: hypothetical protein Q8S33_09370 [Myxococcales bacterium]|nr:hypothetical protein [Myxococcales bacterium]
MRQLLSLCTAALLFGCPSTSGPQGDIGPQGVTGQQGPSGPTGAQGPAGERGEKGDQGEVIFIDGGAARGPAGESVRVIALNTGDAACAQGGVRLVVDGGSAVVCNGAPGLAGPMGMPGPQGTPGLNVTVSAVFADGGCATGGVRLTAAGGTSTLVCNGAAGPAGGPGTQGPAGVAGPTGPVGAAGAQGAQGPPGQQGPAGPQGIAGAQGPAGAQGAQGPAGLAGTAGPQGPAGSAGAQGPVGAPGSAGPAGASVTITALGLGDTSCPFGGSRFTVGATSATACNGAPGGSGGSGSGGGSDAGVSEKVTFAGFTSTTHTGNLGGRTGANAICNAQFGGSHFCTDWEYDQAAPPGPIPNGTTWVDEGDSNTSSRFFRRYNEQLYTCVNWTNDLAVSTWGGNQVRGSAINSAGEFVTTWVSASNGGCQVPRALPCCRGGSLVRFRGYTANTYTGNLGGRAGANAICNANFSRSHFCSDWEWDQAGSPGPVPNGSVWMDEGDSNAQTSRFHRRQNEQLYTCVNWTNDLAVSTWGGNQVRGSAVNAVGEFVSTWVSASNGGCQTPRALPCCE